MFQISDRLPPEIRARLQALQAQKSSGADDAAEDVVPEADVGLPEDDDADDVPRDVWADDADDADDERGDDADDADDADAVSDDEDVSDDDGDAVRKRENDVSAWKGRLKKAQEEAERYRLAAENGSFAAAKLLEMQEKQKAAEAELEELRKERAQWQQQRAADALPEEAAALEQELGADAVKAILSLINKSGGSGSDDVRRLREELQAREAQAHQNRWFGAVSAQIPEFQGMVTTDEAFVEFLKEKKDFSGNSAFDAVAAVGRDMDIEKIGFIRSLIDEYQEGRAERKPKRVASARPMGGGSVSFEKTKRKMTAKDRAHLEALKRKPGARDELIAFRAKFEE